MRLDGAVFATMTLARTQSEERLLRESLGALSALGRPITVADGGSGPEFVRYLHGLPHVIVVTPQRPGLVGQVQASVSAAAASGARFVVYTEPDKKDFFERAVGSFIEQTPDDARLGIAVAARDGASFATFPPTQRSTEGAINQLFGREIGVAADFCYGPLILNPALVPHLEGLDPALGWGWRFYLMALARRAGYEIHLFEADLPCPADQREDDLAERIHRMRQLSQNLQGVMLGLQAPLPAS